MIETVSFLFGLGFSILVYLRSIRPAPLSLFQKASYFVVSSIGITGMVWFCGVLIAHTLRKLDLIP